MCRVWPNAPPLSYLFPRIDPHILSIHFATMYMYINIYSTTHQSHIILSCPHINRHKDRDVPIKCMRNRRWLNISIRRSIKKNNPTNFIVKPEPNEVDGRQSAVVHQFSVQKWAISWPGDEIKCTFGLAFIKIYIYAQQEELCCSRQVSPLRNNNNNKYRLEGGGNNIKQDVQNSH